MFLESIIYQFVQLRGNCTFLIFMKSPFKTTQAPGYSYLTTPARDTGTRDILNRCLLKLTALSVESFCCLITHFINCMYPGNYQTYASLKNIRKIQASTGIRGRTRSSNRISGLKLEYHNHPSPNAVGQWMNELNDNRFELSPDEKARPLTIWLTPVGFSYEFRGMEVGQVATIHIETTRSRNVTFHSPDSHPSILKVAPPIPE